MTSDNHQGREAVAVTQAEAIDAAALYVLNNSRRGNAALNNEQFAADTDALMTAYRDIIGKAIASGHLAHATERASPGDVEAIGWQYALDPCPLTGETRWVYAIFYTEDEARSAGAGISGRRAHLVRPLYASLPAPAVEQPGRASEVERLRATGEALLIAFAELGDGTWTAEKREAYTAFHRALTGKDCVDHPDQAGEAGA